jgi:glycosyltransferase involved in cell wall biosynthesis
MNILFVADVSIAKVIGGSERFLYEQCTRMSQRGHVIHSLTRRLPHHQNDHEVIKGVNEWRYDCDPGNPVNFIKTTWLNTNRLLERLHKKYNFDCINFHQPFSALGINLSKMSSALPKIYTCHSLSFEEFASRDIKGKGIFYKASSFLQIIIRKKIEKYSLKKSNVIAVLSRFTQDKLVGAYNIPREKIKTIPGGVDLKKFRLAGNKAVIRSQLNIPHDKVILFTVRNLVQRMGLENLIIAFHELKKEASDIELVIGGKGPLENGLRTLARSFGIEQKAHFTGFISEEHLPLYYQMADLFVLPTKELEGFGLVTLEAMASGLPVVGTPVGGTTEILREFDSSFLFKGTDPDSMAELIIEKYKMIKHNPHKWQQISLQCRKFVERNYSWEKNINSLEELIAKNLPN